MKYWLGGCVLSCSIRISKCLMGSVEVGYGKTYDFGGEVCVNLVRLVTESMVWKHTEHAFST